MFKLN